MIRTQTGFVSASPATIWLLRRAIDRALGRKGAGKRIVETGSGLEYRLTISKEAVARDAGFCELWVEVAGRLCAFEFDPACGLESWLYALVRSKVAGVQRYRGRHPTEPFSDEAESVAANRAWADAQAAQKRQAQVAALHAAVVELRHVSTTMSYGVFQMHRLEGQTLQHIADVLHLTTEQARWRDNRMTRKLRDIVNRRSQNPSEPDE